MYEEEYEAIDPEEEAEFIQNYLLLNGYGYINTKDIQKIIEAQEEFLRSKGLIEDI